MESSPDAHSILQEPWWWDATALRGWERAEVTVAGELRARWPYVRQRFARTFEVVTAPPLTNRAGPWIQPSTGKLATRYARGGELLEQLIEQLPPSSYFAQNLDPNFDYWIPLHWHGFRVEARVSYVVEDCSDEGTLESGLDEATRRQLKKGRRQLAIEPIGADQLIDLVRKTFRRQGKGMRVSPEVLESVIAASTARNVGCALGAIDSSGRLHSAALVVWDQNKMYYLIGGGDPALRSSGAGTFVLWQAMCNAGKLGLAFDFEGSMLRPIEKFFRGFGARQQLYLSVSRGSALTRAAIDVYRALRR